MLRLLAVVAAIALLVIDPVPQRPVIQERRPQLAAREPHVPRAGVRPAARKIRMLCV